MKKNLFLALMCVASLTMVTACGNGNSNKNNSKSETPTKVEKGKKLDIGDQFAFAGLESAKLVPEGAKEVSVLQTPTRSMNRPMKDDAFFYTGTDADAISLEQLNKFYASVYEAVKAAANDGKVYNKPYMGDTKVGSEMTEPKINKKKTTGRMSCLYKHGDKWFVIDADHDTSSRQFANAYPEPYYGYHVSVQEYFIDE